MVLEEAKESIRVRAVDVAPRDVLPVPCFAPSFGQSNELTDVKSERQQYQDHVLPHHMTQRISSGVKSERKQSQ